MAVHHRNTASSHAQEPPLTIARVALYARAYPHSTGKIPRCSSPNSGSTLPAEAGASPKNMLIKAFPAQRNHDQN
jgi:hypothetical protein